MADPVQGSAARWWRDIDNERRRFGLIVHLRGCSIDIGRRSYRIRWSVR